MIRESGRHLSFPFHITTDGTMAHISSVEEHVKNELIQLLLTNMAERPFLVEFGGGVRSFLFKNLEDTVVGITKSVLIQAISTWLGHRIVVDDLKVEAENEKLSISIKYRLAGTEDPREILFQHIGK